MKCHEYSQNTTLRIAHLDDGLSTGLLTENNVIIASKTYMSSICRSVIP